MFRLAAGSGAQSVEFGVELRLRLDEGAAVVAHGLIAGIRVLGADGDDGGDENDKE